MSIKIGGSIYDFTKNWSDMNTADIKGADKYFHCKANYKSTKRGKCGALSAIGLSSSREIKNVLVDRDPIGESREDFDANFAGMQGALLGKSLEEACGRYKEGIEGLEDF